MHEKIINILTSIGIDVDFMEYRGSANEYIIFSIYNEQDSGLSDDTNDSCKYYVSIHYWYKSLKHIEKYKQIKELMKNNGFIYDGGKDLKDDGFYGKSLDFIYIEYL